MTPRWLACSLAVVAACYESGPHSAYFNIRSQVSVGPATTQHLESWDAGAIVFLGLAARGFRNDEEILCTSAYSASWIGLFEFGSHEFTEAKVVDRFRAEDSLEFEVQTFKTGVGRAVVGLIRTGMRDHVFPMEGDWFGVGQSVAFPRSCSEPLGCETQSVPPTLIDRRAVECPLFPWPETSTTSTITRGN